MKKLRRFNPPGFINYEFREHKDGIRLYKLNWRTYEYSIFKGLIQYDQKSNKFIFDFFSKDYYQNMGFEADLEKFNLLLKHRFDDNFYLTEEAIEYLISVEIMKKLIE